MFKSLVFLSIISITISDIPLVINTWKFSKATENAWNSLENDDNAISALVDGCRTCQELQCDFTVGYGGSPDENGETTLDALIFDGDTINMGAVGGIRAIKDAIGVARHVLQNTEHSLLVGDLAGQFANEMGFPFESLKTNYSINVYDEWKENNCQPNFWMNVVPDPTKSCGPYQLQSDFINSDPVSTNEVQDNCNCNRFDSENHDTIGMIVINRKGHIVAGTSTNGANHKIPGRVGDSPIPGAGAYADSTVGAAAATGDGDIMMRFLPSFLAVERLRAGDSPSQAAKLSIVRISEKYPNFFGGIVVTDKNGNFAAACNGMKTFPFTVMNETYTQPELLFVECAN